MRSCLVGLLALFPLLVAASEAAPGKNRPIRVGIYRGPGVGGPGPEELEKALQAGGGRFASRFLTPEEVRGGALGQLDLVIFPGGSGSRQAEGLGADGRAEVRRFVEGGGGYIGICAGCYLACENFSWSLKILDAKTKSSKWKRGVKMLDLGLEPDGRNLLGAKDGTVTVKYANGPVLEPAGSPDLPDYAVLATFKTETAENDTPKGIQIDSPAILTGTFGKGRVVGISPHPEQTEGLKSFVPRLAEWAVPGAGPTGSNPCDSTDPDTGERCGYGFGITPCQPTGRIREPRPSETFETASPTWRSGSRTASK